MGSLKIGEVHSIVVLINARPVPNMEIITRHGYKELIWV
jgi:hypothetical protein